MNFLRKLNLKKQFKHSSKSFLIILLIQVICIGAVLYMHFVKDIAIATLTRDVTELNQVPVYTGFLSQLGIFFWAGSSAICFLCYRLFIKSGGNDTLPKSFFLTAALLTLFLGFDDVYMLHEKFFPTFHISEKIVYLFYTLFTIYFLIRFFSYILKTQYILLAFALFFFALSVILDMSPITGVDPYILEDSFKFIAIVSWFFYFFQTAKNFLVFHINGKS